MAGNDQITGTWNANSNTGDLIIAYSGRRVEGFYTYQSASGAKARAVIIEDTNKSGSYESSDIIFGGFAAKTKFIRSGKIPTVASGSFIADTETGRFTLFYGSTKYTTGSIYDPSEYF
jgi:hypothetical protein